MLDLLFGEVLDQPNCGISAPSKLAHDLVLVYIDVADVDRVKATRFVGIAAFLNVDSTHDGLFFSICAASVIFFDCGLFPGIAALNVALPDSNPPAGVNPDINYERIRDSRISTPLRRYDNARGSFRQVESQPLLVVNEICELPN